MEDDVRRALQTDRVIDITTIGRTSGLQRRIETWFHRVDDDIYLTGSPGRRDWYANLLGTPEFVFHLKESVVADLEARAVPVTDPESRRRVFARILDNLNQSQDLEAWLTGSPLARVEFTANEAARSRAPEARPRD